MRAVTWCAACVMWLALGCATEVAMGQETRWGTRYNVVPGPVGFAGRTQSRIIDTSDVPGPETVDPYAPRDWTVYVRPAAFADQPRMASGNNNPPLELVLRVGAGAASIESTTPVPMVGASVHVASANVSAYLRPNATDALIAGENYSGQLWVVPGRPSCRWLTTAGIQPVVGAPLDVAIPPFATGRFSVISESSNTDVHGLREDVSGLLVVFDIAMGVNFPALQAGGSAPQWVAPAGATHIRIANNVAVAWPTALAFEVCG